SHDDNPTLPANTPQDRPETDTPTIELIVQRSIPQPTQDDDDKRVCLPGPADNSNNQNTEVRTEENSVPQVVVPPQYTEPVPQQQPRRSTRTRVPTEKTAQDQQYETQLEKAVKESKEAGERAKETRADRRRLIEELQQAVLRGDDTNVGADDIDRVLAALDMIKGIHIPDLGTDTDPDAPKTLDKAWRSSD
ncbi:hypothetical protein C0993_008856, partial [Termitomyces sp. T159_Od127]